MSYFKNAVYLAWSDTKARYRKSVLGPFWPTLTNLLGVIGLGLVWGHLMNQQLDVFIPQLSIGLIVWQLIAGVLIEGPTTFTRQSAMIKNVVTPQSFFVVRMLAKHIINLAHNIVIIFGVMIYYGVGCSLETAWVIPGFLMVAINLYIITYALGLIGARFRDIELLINSVVPILFFVSPVIYRADRLPFGFNIVWLNPFSYMIEAIRAPLLGYELPPHTYLVLVSFLIIGGGLTLMFKRWQGSKLPFWV